MTYNFLKIYYTIWYFLLDRPVYIRYLVELLILVLLIKFVVFIAKRLLPGLAWILAALVKFLEYMIQLGISVAGKVIKNHSRLAAFEEKAITMGEAALTWLADISQKGKDSRKIRVFFSKAFLVWLLFYVLLILPVFHLEQRLDDYYLDVLYAVSNAWDSVEKFMIKDIDQYPYPFIKAEAEAVPETTEDSGEQKEVIHLYLSKEGKNGAYLRNTPELTDENKIRVVHDSDSFVYCGEKSYDGTRWWLKVEVNEGAEYGWISANIVKLKVKGKTVGKILEKDPDKL